MTGLALEGGGVRGSYQAGVYMAMYEHGIKRPSTKNAAPSSM